MCSSIIHFNWRWAAFWCFPSLRLFKLATRHQFPFVQFWIVTRKCSEGSKRKTCKLGTAESVHLGASVCPRSKVVLAGACSRTLEYTEWTRAWEEDCLLLSSLPFPWMISTNWVRRLQEALSTQILKQVDHHHRQSYSPVQSFQEQNYNY